MIPHGAKVFCDTSFFFATLYPKDINYQKAGCLLKESTKSEVSFYTTWDVISETVTLLRYRYSYKAALRFLDEIKPALCLVYYDDSVRKEAELIFRKFSKDQKVSFCDAISFVVVTTVLGGISCFSFDKDFKRFGLNIIEP